jgi:GxxExxY protein
MTLSHPELEDLTRRVIRAGIAVHTELGPGLLESTYEECFYWELVDEGLAIRRQSLIPIVYKSRVIPDAFRIDFVVNESLILEIKAIEKVLPVHKSQVLTYLKLTRIPVGLLCNFNAPRFVDGVTRISL